MNNLFFIILISFLFLNTLDVEAQVATKPNINIVKSEQNLKQDSTKKPLKLKTTILTKSIDELNSEEEVLDIPTEPNVPQVPSSDVDNLLQNIDVEIPQDYQQPKPSRVQKYFKIMKKNFVWLAFFVILVPIILFALMIKMLQAVKKRFAEEKEKALSKELSKEEKFLDEIERSQKKNIKKPKPLSEILGNSNVAFDEEDLVDDEDGFEVEEVVVVEETEEKEETTADNIEDESSIIDSFKIDENLEFFLNKSQTVDLFCKLKGQNISLMQVDSSRKFNKVRKIDSKPGRDVYMVKLDNWRGLIEVTEDSAKFLMDI